MDSSYSSAPNAIERKKNPSGSTVRKQNTVLFLVCWFLGYITQNCPLKILLTLKYLRSKNDLISWPLKSPIKSFRLRTFTHSNKIYYFVNNFFCINISATFSTDSNEGFFLYQTWSFTKPIFCSWVGLKVFPRTLQQCLKVHSGSMRIPCQIISNEIGQHLADFWPANS